MEHCLIFGKDNELFELRKGKDKTLDQNPTPLFPESWVWMFSALFFLAPIFKAHQKAHQLIFRN